MEEGEGSKQHHHHELTGHGDHLPRGRENCGEEEPRAGTAAAAVAMMSMLSVEVVVDEVEPHIVQVAYRQVNASMADIDHFLYHLNSQTDSSYVYYS